MGIQKGDEVYYINSPEFTGGLGNREVIAECALKRMTTPADLLNLIQEIPINMPGQIILWALCSP